MKAALQRRVQRYGWDKAVGAYEHGWRHQLERAQARLLEVAAVHPGQKVLDVACGTGLVTFPVAAAVGAEGAVTATDLSERMVAAASRQADERGIRNVRFERMDAERLHLPDGEYDIVLCSLGLMYVPDPKRAVREFHRVLTNGGRAITLVWGERRNCGWADVFPIVDARVRSEVCPLFFQLGTGELLPETFRGAGFEDVATTRFSSVLPFDSPEAACEAAFHGGPVALAYKRFDQQTREEVHAEYLASIERYRSGAGYEIPGEFVIVAGTRNDRPQ